jgi:hypothetical protein
VLKELSIPINPRQISLVFAMVDKDDTGTISFEEFRAWFAGMCRFRCSVVATLVR